MPLGRLVPRDARRTPSIVVDSMVHVPKALLADVEREKAQLTIANAAGRRASLMGHAGGGPDAFELYGETPTHLSVPRNYRPMLRGSLERNHDYVVLERVVRPHAAADLGEDRVDLRKFGNFDQQPAFDALIAPPRGPWGKILALRCRAGKTYIALKAAHYRGGRTLWVTMSSTLIEQAKVDIEACLGLSPESVGHVQAARCDWEGRSIAVAMLHSLALRDYPAAFWEYWDLVIFDEGDVLAADLFCRVAGRFRGERWLITATPKRADGMEALFELHIGPVCYSYLEYDLKPDCYFVPTAAPASCEVRTGWDPVKKERRPNFQLMAKEVMLNDGRAEQLVKLVAEATSNGRTCLVLGDSVDGMLHNVQLAKRRLPGVKHGVIIGRVTKQGERMRILADSQVIWATTKLFMRGMTRNDLDTVIVASIAAVNAPLWRQAIGRVLGYKEGKRAPIVVVLSDVNVAPLRAMAAKLAALFRAEGWPINEMGQRLVNERRAQKRRK